ncbi:HTTM domain-containing protein [Sorangium sp. So ce260]|uniref:HTTM domain-containing protein n=1 Tax=Sorangium sp. So ce260 TaxID=3133291 RepID=UPI003F5D7DA8
MNGQAIDLRATAAGRGLTRVLRSIERFAFAPASAAPLAALRVGLAAVLLLQAALVAPALYELYGRSGILQGPLRDMFARTELPRIGWAVALLAPLGVGEDSVILGTGVIYVLALAALLVGWWTRTAAVVAWLTHLMLMMTANSTVYGADSFANIFLFYLIWMPSAAAFSLDRRLGRVEGAPTPGARLGLRVVQLHLCIAYLTGGLGKAVGEQWWNGEAIWRSVMLPEYRQLDFSWLASHPWLAAAMGWTVLLVEIGYAFLIWPRRTRRAWVVATVAMHAGIALFMGLLVFGAIMAVFTIAAFAVPSEPPGATAVAGAAPGARPEERGRSDPLAVDEGEGS